jgi:flagellar M-ring protein FliF
MSNQLTQQIAAFWSHLTAAQKVMVLVLILAGAVLVPMFISWANTPSYTVAFSGLSEADAGQVVEQLAEDGTSYQLQGSGTILVPSDKVYEVRLKMARLGLPQGGTVGFELFSGSTLGMTEFTQRVNYQQALEGELERTIASMAAVDGVRVHIVTPEKTLLSEQQTPASASVVVQESGGRSLDSTQVRSITHLVASSVEGLKPENVVVVDVNGNLLAGASNGTGGPAAQTDVYRAAELAGAREIQVRVQDLLNSVLGPNRSVVQADISMDWTQRESTTQSFEPQESVLRSSQEVTETYKSTGGSPAGIPGAETNLPPAAEAEAGTGQASDYQRSEKVTNYEITQTETREVQAPGRLERISLSVLVDGVTDTQQLNVMKEAIAAAAGIDPSRGDTLVVDSLAFDRSFFEAQAVDLEKGERTNLYVQIGQYVIAGLILLGLLWYVQRLLSNLRLATSKEWSPILRPVSQLAANSDLDVPYSLDRESPRLQTGEKVPVHKPKVELPPPSPDGEDIHRVVSRLTKEDPASLAEVIRFWLNEETTSGG